MTVKDKELAKFTTNSSGETSVNTVTESSIVGTDGSTADVIPANGQLGLVTITPGHVSEDNSTNVVLDPAGTNVFTGDWEDILNHGVIVLTVKASHVSATDGLCVCFSTDGINTDSVDSFTIPADEAKTFSFQAATRYFRIVYSNGTTAQTYFRLQTIVKPYYVKPSSHRIADKISGQDDAELVKSVITAQDPSGDFNNLTSTLTGNLKVANVEDGLSIAKGVVANTSFIHKFGNAPLFDIADGFVSIWDGADTTNTALPDYTFSTTADITRISSSNASDTQPIEIQGLDADYNLVVQTKTLTGQTPVTLDTPLIRVFRMKNVGVTDILGLAYIYTSTGTVTAGVPNTASSIRAVINDGNNQTLMAIYTVPAGKTAYMRAWYASTSGARKTSTHLIKLFARNQGSVFQLKHIASISSAATSNTQHNYVDPEVFLEKTDIQMKVNTDENNSGVSAGFDIVLIDN